MSIFSKLRTPDEADQARAALATESNAHGGQPEPPASVTPRFVPPVAAAGVVPPPAAPIYSMRPPAPAPRVDGDAEGSLAESLRMAGEAQLSARGGLRVAMERTRPGPAPRHVRRPQGQRPAPTTRRAAQSRPRQAFDPVAAAQAGLLNLAWRWQETGSPIRAIHAYMQVLTRYPGSAGAAAAVADLMELSDKLSRTGQFHIALGIYDRLEELLADDPC